MNRCSPVIGSPLHVACADNIPHRVEIMKVFNYTFIFNCKNHEGI